MLFGRLVVIFTDVELSTVLTRQGDTWESSPEPSMPPGNRFFILGRNFRYGGEGGGLGDRNVTPLAWPGLIMGPYRRPPPPPLPRQRRRPPLRVHFD